MKRWKKKNWVKLDNAAKIFPPATDEMDPKVFRFACELYEEVQPRLLQTALETTLSIFQNYQVVLKHGFFWYYLEDTDLTAQVHEENQPVCQKIYDKNETGLLFDVSYYKKRINLEIYHALADGTGALHFLRELVCRYLNLAHEDDLPDVPPDSGYDASASEKMADSFDKYYMPQKIKRTNSPKAYRIKKPRLPENRLKVIEGILPTDQMLALTKQYGVTLTAFLTALLICSIAHGMTVREKRKIITISVPVNLRNYFASESSRNFFSVINVSYQVKQEEIEFEDVLAEIKKQMEQKLSPEKIKESMNNLIAIEKNAFIRVIPLFIKDFFMNIGYQIADNAVTAAVSNIGRVKIPEVYKPYIRLFDVITSTKKIQICLCSYENNLVLSFTDGFITADVQKYFFRQITAMGVPVEIVSTPMEEGGRKHEKMS